MDLAAFSGEAELAPIWDEFAKRYTNDGQSDARVAEINLLNEFLSAETTPAGFLARHKALGFKALKESFDHVCQVQAEEGAEKGPERNLNDYIVSRMVDKWIGMLTPVGLYPPPESSSVPRSVKTKRDELRGGESAGGLLASSIASASLMAIRGAIKEVKGKLSFADGADLSMVEAEAVKVFDNTLFSYNESKGNQDVTQGARFKNYLYGRIVKIATSKVLGSITRDVSMDQDSGASDERTLHDKMPDSKAVDPSVSAERTDQVANILRIIQGELDDREQEVIKRRFGLGEDQKEHSLKEIGEELGLTRERIRQIEQAALRIIRSHANGGAEGEERPVARPFTSRPVKAAPIPEVFTPAVLEQDREPATLKSVDYPYISLTPVTGELSGDALTERKSAEARHITDMLSAGMSPQWSAKPKFYEDVFAQWQSILATRKGIAGASIIDNAETQRLVLELAQSLTAHAPDTSYAQSLKNPTAAREATNGLSYNAVYRRFKEVDFSHPEKIAQAMVYDPRWRDEVTGYLAHVPAAQIAEQLQEVYKPVCFEKSASFGECLEAYVLCGGGNITEFLQLYGRAKGYTKIWKGQDIVSAEMLAEEINQGSSGEAVKIDTVHGWIHDNSAHAISQKHRDMLVQRYVLTDKQKLCLEFINGTIRSIDSAESILNREDEKLKSDKSPNVYATAFTVLKDLIGIHPDLTPEGLSTRIDGAISPIALQRWMKGHKINPDTLLPHIDQVSSALVPGNAALARRAANLMLALPSSETMTFHDAITFARKQGYTVREFIDMRRFQFRDEIREVWDKAHGASEEFNQFHAFEQFVRADKPAAVKFSESTISGLRKPADDYRLEPRTLDFIATKLGAADDKDKIMFRQLVHACPLDAGQEKVDEALDEIEKAGDDVPKRQAAFKNMLVHLQERDGLSGLPELSQAMVAYAKKSALQLAKEPTDGRILKALTNLCAFHASTSEDKAAVIAAYAFQADDDRRKRLNDRLAGVIKITEAPEVQQGRVDAAFDALQETPTRQNFEALMASVEARDGLKSHRQLSVAICDYAEGHNIVPADGKLTADNIYNSLRNFIGVAARIESPVRAAAIAGYFFQKDSERSTALESMLSNGVAAPPPQRGFRPRGE